MAAPQLWARPPVAILKLEMAHCTHNLHTYTQNYRQTPALITSPLTAHVRGNTRFEIFERPRRSIMWHVPHFYIGSVTRSYLDIQLEHHLHFHPHTSFKLRIVGVGGMRGISHSGLDIRCGIPCIQLLPSVPSPPLVDAPLSRRVLASLYPSFCCV